MWIFYPLIGLRLHRRFLTQHLGSYGVFWDRHARWNALEGRSELTWFARIIFALWILPGRTVQEHRSDLRRWKLEQEERLA